MSLSNYPPGVTGNEPEIAGYPPCAICGHESEEHEHIEGLIYVCHGGVYNPCDCQGYEQFRDAEPDPDEAYERRRERERG